MEDNVYKMQLHDVIKINGFEIMRVPGGWVYVAQGATLMPCAAVFVPLNSEFNRRM